MTPESAVRRVLAASGVGFPRGILGPEVRALARALEEAAERPDAEALVDAAAGAHWAELAPPVRAALERAAASVGAEDEEAFEIALSLSDDPDPRNPLARALAIRSAAELRRAQERARELIAVADAAVSDRGDGASAAVAQVAGAAATELLELDPDDFAPEIAEYATGEHPGAALERLARETGDLELRTWAREELRALAPAGAAGEAVARLVAGPPPDDPADDLVWVGAILTLAEQGVERSLVEEVEAPARPSGPAPAEPD